MARLTGIGRFRNLAFIGRGGMAEVYRADGTEYGTVAVKVPLEGADLDRFRIEALVQAKLRHPNIVSALDANRPGEPEYIVMEYIEAPTLRAVLAAHPGGLSPVAAARVGIGVCHALAHAYSHAKLRAHRDIKPGNIFADVHGDTVGLVKLSDFGVVKRLDDGGGMGTRFLGAPHYMSPEQINASALVTELTDIYSLGCVLYEMATGRPPFEGNPMQVMNEHLGKEPIPPSRCRPGLPDALDAIIMRCLAKNPRHRFASVLDLAAALASDGSATRSRTTRFGSGPDHPVVPAPPPPDWAAPAPAPEGPRIGAEDPLTAEVVEPSSSSPPPPRREAGGYLEHLETDKVLGPAGGPPGGYGGPTPAGVEPPWGQPQATRDTPVGVLLAVSVVGLVLYLAVILVLVLAASRPHRRRVLTAPPRATASPRRGAAGKAGVGTPAPAPVRRPIVPPKAMPPPAEGPEPEEPKAKEPAPPEPKDREPAAKEPGPPEPKAEEPPVKAPEPPEPKGQEPPVKEAAPPELKAEDPPAKAPEPAEPKAKEPAPPEPKADEAPVKEPAPAPPKAPDLSVKGLQADPVGPARQVVD